MIKKPKYICKLQLNNELLWLFIGNINLFYLKSIYLYNYYHCEYIARIDIHQCGYINSSAIKIKCGVPPVECPENFKYENIV